MDPVIVTIVAGGAGAIVGIVSRVVYKAEFWRRGVIADRLHDFASPNHYAPVPEDPTSKSRMSLKSVFWEDKDNCYVDSRGRRIALEPLKTITLNFHWSIHMDRVAGTMKSTDDLSAGVRAHVVKEGVKVGADSFFMTEQSNAHGNPIYSVTFFRIQRSSASESLLEDIRTSSAASSTPSSAAITSP